MKDLVPSALLSLTVRVLGAAAAFGLSVLLARTLGAEGTGHYFLVATVAVVGAVLGRVGLDNAVLRLTASHAAANEWAVVKGLQRKALLYCVSASCVAALLMFAAAPWIASRLFGDQTLTAPLRYMALGVVPMALYNLYAQFLLALKRVASGIAVLTLWPATFTAAGLILLIPTWKVNGAAAAFSLGSFAAMMIGMWVWNRATPKVPEPAPFATAELLQSSMPLFWVSVAQLVVSFSPTLVLGAYGTGAEVGLFGVASRLILLVGFIFTAVSSVAAPRFAALHANGDSEGLARMARQTTLMLMLTAVPVLGVFVIAPHGLLAVFGPQFSGAAVATSIMALGQLINVITGLSGNILMMCGYERYVRNTLLLCAATSLLLSWLLVPALGLIGAAIATAAETTIESLIMLAMLWSRFRFTTLPWPLRRAAIRAY